MARVYWGGRAYMVQNPKITLPGFALTLGILGGLAGYNLGNRAGSDVGPVAALVVGAGAGGIGFLAGGFLGGFAQYWVQVYPERTAEPGWQSSRKQREQR